MTEFQVWRTIVDWVENQGGTVHAACPPGSSVYDCRKFCIIDPETRKRDEPDILFSLNGILYFMECKPTLSGSMRHGKKVLSNENDIEKLQRIKATYDKGTYDKQLIENYGINTADYAMKIAIGYAYNHSQPNIPLAGIIRYEINSDFSITIVEG